MSTTLLYQGLGIRGYRYVRTEFIEGAVVFQVEQEPNTFRCSACGSPDVVRRGKVPRLFRHLPIGSKRVWIALDVPRLGCCTCGVVRQASIRFASFEPDLLERAERGGHVDRVLVLAHAIVVFTLAGSRKPTYGG